MARRAEEQTVVVVGAGLVGAMTAVLLGRRGYRVKVYEGRADPRSHPSECAGAGGAAGDSAMLGRLANATKRSINLALSHRGLCALRKIGLEQQVLREAVPMEGRMIHPRGQADVAVGSIFQPYEHRPGHAIYSISREDLNFALLREVDTMPNVETTFGAKFEAYDKTRSEAVFSIGEGSTKRREAVACAFVVGADGAFSKVREALGRLERLNFSRQYITTAYKEFSIPATPAGEYAMPPHALHIWPRDDFMLIALPNADKSFTCTLFMPVDDIASIADEAAAEQFFRDCFADVAKDSFQVMPTMAKDFFANPTSPLLSVKCDPWHHADKMVIIGDAAHACLPFYGQGMNAGFEDALRLDELLDTHEDNVAEAFKALSDELVPSRYGLVEASIRNHLDMQKKTNSTLEMAKKKVDWLLESLLPGTWIPLYTMVTFTRIPYDEALRRAERQDTLLHRALALSSLLLVGLGATACRRLAAR